MHRAIALLLSLALAVPAFAQITTGPKVWIPHSVANQSIPATASCVLDATTDRCGWVFTEQKTCTIGTSRFAVGTTTTAAGSTIRASPENVDMTTGSPDETDDQFRVTGAVTAADNSIITTGLLTTDGTDSGGKRSVTVGDRLAYVLKYESFTAADSVQMRTFSAETGQLDGAQFYMANNTTGAYVKSIAHGPMTLLCDDGTVAAQWWWPAFVVLSTVTINSSLSPDEAGMLFSFPWPTKIDAVACYADVDEVTEAVLYSAAGATTLGTFDPGVRGSTAAQWQQVSFLEIDITAGRRMRSMFKTEQVAGAP